MWRCHNAQTGSTLSSTSARGRGPGNLRLDGFSTAGHGETFHNTDQGLRPRHSHRQRLRVTPCSPRPRPRFRAGGTLVVMDPMEIARAYLKGRPPGPIAIGRSEATTSLLPIPAIGSIARGTQPLNCSMHAPWSRALNNSAIECRVLWNQFRDFAKDSWRSRRLLTCSRRGHRTE